MRERISALIITLTSVCLLAALLLAFVYKITKEPIARQLRLEKLRAINKVLLPHDNEPDKDFDKIIINGKEFIVYKGKKGKETIGYAFETYSKDGYGGTIKLMVGVDKTGKITGVEVLLHRETPGLGAKIEKEEFKKQFIGKSLKNSKFLLKKYGGDIDQITGATISSRAFTAAIKKGLTLFKEYLKEKK